MIDMTYKTREHIVAFIDILGATAKINSNAEESLNVVHGAYNDTLQSLDLLFSSELSGEYRPGIRIFSDNIIIYLPAEENKRYAAFVAVAIFSALIQHHFLRNGYLVRGGIAIGSFFADDVMVWGQALVDAYTIENTIAIYPRIVVHPDIVQMIHLADDERKQKWIQQDTDDLFFIDYMQPGVLYPNEIYPVLLMHYLDNCDHQIAEAKGKLRILQKINWHSTYLTSKLLKLPEAEIADGLKERESNR